jgi:cytochrome c oxidase cbb3-type subunit 2
VYDRPFQFGSKRTGPDLARVGGRYSDDWQRLHLMDPRALVPESNMPAYPWLAENEVDGRAIVKRMLALKTLGHPYTDEQIGAAEQALAGKTEMDAMIAYLQGLGTGLQASR